MLDIGCGTGSLAIRLAERGIEVVAVDPAPASLHVAEAKSGAERVRWLHGDATYLPDLEVDLVVMTGNVAQVFLTDEAWSQTLAGFRSAPRPGGHLVLESRRPLHRAWERWAEDASPAVRVVPGIGEVTHRRAVTSVQLPLVSFRHEYTCADGQVVGSSSTLIFRRLDELEVGLIRADFEVLEVRQAPDRPGAEYVVIARAD